MDIKNKVASVILIASAFLSFSAHVLADSLPTLVWCPNCNDTQKKNLAATYPIGTTVFVGDPQNQNYKGWYIDQGWTETQPAQSYPKPVVTTASPALEDKIEALMGYYNVTPVGWHKAVSLNYGPINSGVNVYGVVNSGTTQNSLLANVLGNNYIAITLFANQLAGYAAMVHMSPGSIPIIDVTIYFADGSTIVVSIDTTRGTPSASVKDDSGIDSHLNSVHSHAQPQNTVWTFNFPPYTNTNPNDFQNWLTQMGLLGYTIPVSQMATWACTNSPGTGLHCVHPF